MRTCNLWNLRWAWLTVKITPGSPTPQINAPHGAGRWRSRYKVFEVMQPIELTFLQDKSWSMLSYGFWLLQSCAVHHYAVGMAPGCSGDGWSSRSLRVQSPDSEFTVGMAQQKRRESLSNLIWWSKSWGYVSLQMYLLRAAGILLPLYVVMRLIHIVQSGQRQYRLQLLEVSPDSCSLISWGRL